MQLNWSKAILVCKRAGQEPTRQLFRRKKDIAAEVHRHKGLPCGGSHSIELAIMGA